MEKLTSEKEDLLAGKAVAEEVSKRAQKQLRDLRDELADAQKKEMEIAQKSKEQVCMLRSNKFFSLFMTVT